MSESAIQPAIGLPPNETVEFFRAKGTYPISRRWWDVWEEEHLRAFTVAKIMDRQLLERIRASLDEVLANGGTFEMWKERILPELKNAGWWGKVQNKELTGTNRAILVSEGRLRTIYGTNLRMARAAGQWKRIQALKAVRPYLLYSAMRDGRTRPKHRVWGGVDSGRPIILPVDHPAWRWMYPPNGWNCRCLVIQLSEADLKRRGLSVTTDAQLLAMGWPISDTLDPANSSDFVRGHGIIERVPNGVDPGFGYNVGQHHLRGFVPAGDIGEIVAPIISTTPKPAMPAPRLVPDLSLSPDMDMEEVIRRFKNHLGTPDATGTVIFNDVLGEPIIIDDSFFFRGGTNLGPSTWKLDNSDRRKHALYTADALKEPDEIWYVWERVLDKDGGSNYRVTRRYVSYVTVGGKNRPMIVVVTVNRDGWQGTTAFAARNMNYAEKDMVRGGVLAYRRK